MGVQYFIENIAEDLEQKIYNISQQDHFPKLAETLNLNFEVS